MAQSAKNSVERYFWESPTPEPQKDWDEWWDHIKLIIFSETKIVVRYILEECNGLVGVFVKENNREDMNHLTVKTLVNLYLGTEARKRIKAEYPGFNYETSNLSELLTRAEYVCKGAIHKLRARSDFLKAKRNEGESLISFYTQLTNLATRVDSRHIFSNNGLAYD